MEVVRMTESVCPVCYDTVPALIERRGDNSVWMVKECKKHGVFHALVERDYGWWKHCMDLGHTNIYDGYLLDVTDKCNLKCKYCYHPKGSTIRDVDEIVEDAKDAITHGVELILVTGGEPTLHPELPLIIRRLKEEVCEDVMVLTNGVAIAGDEKLLFDMRKAGLEHDNMVDIGLSIHPEAEHAWRAVLEHFRRLGLKVRSTMYTVAKAEEVQGAVEIYQEFKDVIGDMRIHAATNMWDEKGAINRVCVSDMLKVVLGMGEAKLVMDGEAHRVPFAPVTLDGMNLKLISWHDTGCMDLWDMENGAPYYRAMDGNLYHFTIATLVDEKMEMEKGGVRIRRGVVADVPTLCTMWVRLMEEEGTEGAFPNPQAWIEQTIALMSSPNYHLYVAEVQGVLVGFMDGVITFDPSRNCKVMTGRHIYIEPEYRDGEVGIMMHREGVKYSRNNGVEIFARMEQNKRNGKIEKVVVEHRI